MSTTYPEAIDEIFSHFNNSLSSKASEIIGEAPICFWQGKTEIKPDSSKFWLRISQQTVLERMETLANPVKRYQTSGLVFIQIFCPKIALNSFYTGRLLAELCRNIFRGRTDNVWFKNSRIKELGPEDSYYRFNVISEYEYFESF
jgi:hypothetical protein